MLVSTPHASPNRTHQSHSQPHQLLLSGLWESQRQVRKVVDDQQRHTAVVERREGDDGGRLRFLDLHTQSQDLHGREAHQHEHKWWPTQNNNTHYEMSCIVRERKVKKNNNKKNYNLQKTDPEKVIREVQGTLSRLTTGERIGTSERDSNNDGALCIHSSTSLLSANWRTKLSGLLKWKGTDVDFFPSPAKTTSWFESLRVQKGTMSPAGMFVCSPWPYSSWTRRGL